MHLEITPEPSSEERAAIAAAIAALLAPDKDEPGAWWEAGACENLEHPEQDGLDA